MQLGDQTDHLTGLTVQQMRRKLKWNARATGRCTYTLGGTLLLTSLVEEMIHNEAATTGCPVTDFVPPQSAILGGHWQP